MPTFESIPPSEAVITGRSKLGTLQVLKRRSNEPNSVITSKHVDAARSEAEKAISLLETELGLERNEHGIRHYTALDDSMYSRRTLALVNDLYEATGKIRA
jgi:hypothetical protein|uniref:Uncharacterized protein n=1 Tax=viral metagenome TaxID=1070528 RepID=A0A6C0CUZ5_9ZZZZ